MRNLTRRELLKLGAATAAGELASLGLHGCGGGGSSNPSPQGGGGSGSPNPTPKSGSAGQDRALSTSQAEEILRSIGQEELKARRDKTGRVRRAGEPDLKDW